MQGADLPDLGQIQPVAIRDFSGHYYEHPDQDVDLACINISAFIAPENKVFFRNLHPEFVENLDFSKVLPGAEVSFVGYPDNRFDSIHNLPIMRKGYLATLPTVNFNGSKQVIIDAQVFPGSSGSPVFVIIDGFYRLLGVISRTMIKNAKLMSIPTQHSYGVEQTIGLGIVLETVLVQELLEYAKNGLSDKIALPEIHTA